MRFQWLAMMVALLLFVACNNPDSGSTSDTGSTNKGVDAHGHDHEGEHGDEHADGAHDDHADEHGDEHADGEHGDDHADDDHGDAHADDGDHGEDHGEDHKQETGDADHSDDHAGDGNQEKESENSTAAKEDDSADKTDAVEAEPAELTVAEQLAKIKADYEKDVEQFMSDYRAASKEEQAKMRPKFGELRVAAATKSLEIAREVAESDEAVQGLLTACEMGSSDEQKEAMGLLLKHHADSEEIGTLCQSLSRGSPSAESEASLKRILAESPHDKVKAAAQYGLISFYKSVKSAKKFAESNDSFKPPQFVLDFDTDSVDLEAMYTTLRDDYGDLKAPRGTYGELAERALFELQNLSIGKVAPDIEGKDLDGEPFKLSDYRGKVVMLDFWGDW